MRQLLVRKFVKDYKSTGDPEVRGRYGRLSSVIGVIINMVLSLTKLVIGIIIKSVAITGDGINNLSDAGSSLISLISFKLAQKPADKKHPFGHARIEYVGASLVAVLILAIALELFKTSISRIIEPVSVRFSAHVVASLVLSIIVKLWLFSFNKDLGEDIDSPLLLATAADSLSDVVATSAVLLSGLVGPLIGIQLDGYMGVGVSLFVMFSGIVVLKETINNIIGQKPDADLVKKIDAFVKKHDGILGTHDLVVHEYGPGQCFATVHAEVDAKVHILDSHDLIDNIERDIHLNHGIHLVIHIDPVIRDDPYVDKLRDLTKKVVKSVDESLQMHDFRLVKGKTHSNLIFDVTVPFDCPKSDKELLDSISSKITQIDKDFYVVITFDRAYTSLTHHNAPDIP